MKMTIIVASCSAVLCLAALAVWTHVNRTTEGNLPIPEEDMSNGQTSYKSAHPTEKRKMDLRVFELPVNNAFLGNDQFPCYLDQENKTLYRWMGINLRLEQLPSAYKGTVSGARTLDTSYFTVVPVEALIKYRKTDEGYRPGYLDRSARVFYEWKGVVLSKQEVPDKSRDGKDPIADSRGFSEVIQIDMPARLKGTPEAWKKGGAYNPEAGIRAEKMAAEKLAAEKKALEERSRNPDVFQLPERVTVFGEDEYSPCYFNPEDRDLYRWNGVVLRWKQVPEAYKGRPAPKIVMPFTEIFNVVPVEAPVKYRKTDKEYRPGYVDRSSQAFYEWKGVVLSRQEVPDKSRDGKDAIADPTLFNEIIEIDMPAHLKNHPELWKMKQGQP